MLLNAYAPGSGTIREELGGVGLVGAGVSLGLRFQKPRPGPNLPSLGLLLENQVVSFQLLCQRHSLSAFHHDDNGLTLWNCKPAPN